MYNILQKYFGYTSFYPLQEEIINEALSRRDVFVLMPTGGGKSLCYQLPAMLLDGLTIVISPLIALMKDQVDGLLADGIPATLINSSLTYGEIDARRRSLANNEVRILYIAPERLVMPEFLQFLQGLKIALFAIDESHCISEWGHDFRPEYRQLNMLKERFPSVPIMALTATATSVVQEDIIKQLKIADGKTFKASFNRKNLYYQIRPKENPYQQLLRYLDGKKTDSGIIYCQSRKTVESVAAGLKSEGYRALPYHAGLSSEARSENQERFIRDDVEIIVATIAFGMGIDKPNVRYVVHYDLPKSIEGYYQETGRAGRDGLKSDCILFFSYGDKYKIEHFIKQKEDENEREVAYKQLRELTNYCEGNVCRRKMLLAYFGEVFSEQNCGACDICLEPKELFEGTVAAQKALSCIYRVGERFGVNYVIDVLLGSKNQKVLQNHHDEIKTFGVGKEYSKIQWQTFIRELVQLGYAKLEGDEYPILKLGEKSKQVLFQNEKVFLTKPLEKPFMQKVAAGDNYDRVLFDRLRALRKTAADKEGVPPYVIFHDTSLKEMSVSYPGSLADLRKISGVGEMKLKKYGDVFLREIIDYCTQHGIKQKPNTLKYQEAPIKQQKSLTAQVTFDLYKQGLSIQQIAARRGLAPSTISSHLEKLILEGEAVVLDSLMDTKKQQHIKQMCLEMDTELLTPLKEKLGEDYSYEEIRLVRAQLIMEERND